MNHPTLDTDLRELAQREGDGVEVTLLWCAGTDVVSVMVVDSRNDEAFELVLDHDDRPLDVFDHPFAHAARRGIELRGSSREHDLLPA